MRNGTVHLVGGGPGTLRALRKHFRAALDDVGVARPLVAYVGTASNDNGAFFAMVRGALALSGARFRMARIASPRAKASEARALLDDCDLVFVSGGDVDHGMRVLEDRGMASPLRKLAGQRKPMFGISAGSIMLAREWVRFPNEDETGAELFPCLGIMPGYVDAHAEDDDWAELRILLRLLHLRGDPAPTGYGLTRQGALRLAPDGTLTPLGTPIPRFTLRRGSVVAAAPLR